MHRVRSSKPFLMSEHSELAPKTSSFAAKRSEAQTDEWRGQPVAFPRRQKVKFGTESRPEQRRLGGDLLRSSSRSLMRDFFLSLVLNAMRREVRAERERERVNKSDLLWHLERGEGERDLDGVRHSFFPWNQDDASRRRGPRRREG